MQMLQLGKPVIGPAPNFCRRCRVPAKSVIAVPAYGPIPAMSEPWFMSEHFHDLLDHRMMEMNEAQLQEAMQRVVANVGSEKAKELAANAILGMTRLSDRQVVGQALALRLERVVARRRAGVANDGMLPLPPTLMEAQQPSWTSALAPFNETQWLEGE